MNSDKAFNILNTFLLILFSIVVLYPLVYIASASISSPQNVISGRVWLYPVDITLIGYKAIFKNRQIISGVLNSLFYAFFGTIINIVITFMAAYPLAHKELKGKRLFKLVFLFTMIFSGGMIPTYLLINNLGLMNSRWAMILPNAMSIWNMFITKAYIETNIPDELYQSSQIDGAGYIRMAAYIALPLSAPIIAVISLFYAVDHWNSYFDALLYLKKSSLFPLQIILRNIIILNSTDSLMLIDASEVAEREALSELLKYSLIIFASAPVMCIYPMVQKFFIKGIMIGSIKG